MHRLPHKLNCPETDAVCDAAAAAAIFCTFFLTRLCTAATTATAATAATAAVTGLASVLVCGWLEAYPDIIQRLFLARCKPPSWLPELHCISRHSQLDGCECLQVVATNTACLQHHLQRHKRAVEGGQQWAAEQNT
jgi:hypothetical protein